MKAEMIAVGTEILLGQIVNTNAQFISQQFAGLGVDLYYETVIGDNVLRLKEALGIAFARVDLVILTGGLGPTKDDLTKETVAEYFGAALEMHQPSLAEISGYFQRVGRPMTENNKKQAMLPQGCIVMKNNHGTAPGCILEKDGKTAVMLPGPPTEMKFMFLESVVPYLKSKSTDVIASKSVRLFGTGESAVETQVRDLMERQNPTVAPYAKEGEVELRVTAKASAQEEAEALIAPAVREIQNRLGEFVYGYDEDTLESVTVEFLKQNGLTVSTAESCTGGLIAGAITEVPGSSEVFGFGVVTYANQAKVQMAGVRAETLEKYGAVSPQTAEEMARGIREKSGSDLGVSATGIAGPDGGSEEKPVGLVYIALAGPKRTVCRKLNLNGNRASVRKLTKMNVLDMIRKEGLQ